MSDEEWALVAPYLTLMDLGAPQREHSLRDLFNALRWMVRLRASWRYMPFDFPPWQAVYQQTRRWMAAGVFEAVVTLDCSPFSDPGLMRVSEALDLAPKSDPRGMSEIKGFSEGGTPL